jgi:hypothetical protein
MYVAGGRRRWLPSLGNHTRAISELHAYVEEHRSPTADTVPDAAVTGGLVSGRPGHTRLRVLAGAALVGFGLLLGLAGIGAGVAQTRLASTGVVTEATVTDVQPRSCYKYSCDCPMTWTFTDRSGTTYAGTSDDCSSLYDEAEVGATIPVVYDPTMPTVNQVNDRPPDPAGPAAAGALFAYFALGAGVGLVLAPVRMGMKRPSGSEPHM